MLDEILTLATDTQESGENYKTTFWHQKEKIWNWNWYFKEVALSFTNWLLPSKQKINFVCVSEGFALKHANLTLVSFYSPFYWPLWVVWWFFFPSLTLQLTLSTSLAEWLPHGMSDWERIWLFEKLLSAIYMVLCSTVVKFTMGRQLSWL